MLIRNFLNWRDAILFEDDKGDGGGEGGNQEGDTFDKARAMATIEKLREFEKEAKRLQRELGRYEGKTILDADQTAAWTEYQKLGAIPDITKALQERDASKAELTMMKRAQQVRDVAETAGYNPNVLSQMDAIDSLTYEKQTVTQDGKAQQIVMVSGGKAEKPMALQEYAVLFWKDFLPALQPGDQRQGATFAPQLSGSANQFATAEEIARKKRGDSQYHAL